jgi:hypothetical protein
MAFFGRSVAAAVAVASFLAGSSAWADGLTAPLAASAARSAAAIKDVVPGVIRQRDVAIDAAYLARTVAPLGIDGTEGRVKAAPAGPNLVRIELFPGVTADLARSALGEAVGGGFVWSGHEAAGKAAGADLVVRDGRVTGVVTHDGRTYRIDPLPGSAAHRVREIDPAAFPEDIHLHVRLPKASGAPLPQPRATTPTEVTVLIGYTARAKARVADIVAQANLAVTMANSAFARSGAAVRFRLVGTRLVSGYDEKAVSGYEQVLYGLTNGTAPFAPLQSARTALRADLVSVLIDRPEYCGIAWGLYEPTVGHSRYGMSVVTIGCVANYTFSHETGHNMGLRHDRYVEPAASTAVYNYGYVDLTGRFRDIMSYSNRCSAAGIVCTRIPYFSNPAVTYNGRPTGIRAGLAGAADGARKLNATRGVIAAFR